METKSYNKWTIIYLVIIIAPFLFNVMIDPYGYFQIVEIPSVNKKKTEVISEYATKYYYLKKARPNTLLLGTSRMLTFRPEDVSKYTGDGVYNLGLSGSNSYEQFIFLKYAVEQFPVKHVVIGADFFSYNPDNLNKAGFSAERFARGFYYKDYRDGVIGIESLKSSVLTLKNNALNSCESIYYKEGFSTWCSREKAASEGISANVEREMKSSLKTFATDKAAYNSKQFLAPTSTSDNLFYLRSMIELCRSKNITLKIFISPIYEAQFDLIYAMGLGETYERWKYEMAQLTDYFDFTGRNSITTNKDYWWDTSHINRKGGRFIFGCLFNDKSLEIPHDFGTYVSKQNVDNHVKALRKQVKTSTVADI
jgi:hypothetical protein